MGRAPPRRDDSHDLAFAPVRGPSSSTSSAPSSTGAASIIRERRGARRRARASRSTGRPSPTPGAPATSRRCSACAAASSPGPTSTSCIAQILDALLPRFGLESLDEAERDAPQPRLASARSLARRVAGLARLKRRFIIGTLSNGNVSLLVDMAKHAGLPWDCVLSAELFRHYKPDPEVYLGAARPARRRARQS